MANITPCNFLAPTVIEASVPFDPFFKRTKKKILFHTKFRLSSLKEKLFPKKMTKKITSISESPISETTTLNLQPGEWVQVRSFDEISATLNEEGKFKGLYFMPEMEKFCGKKFKVDSLVKIIRLESTGEVRKLNTPSIFLEGVYCNGERHEGCGRKCYHFWKEAWLKR